MPLFKSPFDIDHDIARGLDGAVWHAFVNAHAVWHADAPANSHAIAHSIFIHILLITSLFIVAHAI